MRRSLSLSLSLVALAALAAGGFNAVAQTPDPVNPVGTYVVSTLTEEGSPLSGTLTVRAANGNFTGEFSSDAGGTIPIRQVTTSATHMMAAFDSGESLAVAWLERQPDGTFTGSWHTLMPGVNVKMTKAK